MTVMRAVASQAAARLPPPLTDQMALLIETLGSRPVGDGIGRLALASTLGLSAGFLSPLLNFLECLGLVRQSSDRLVLTMLGVRYARSGRHLRAHILGEQLRQHVLLVTAVSGLLARQPRFSMPMLDALAHLKDRIVCVDLEEQFRRALAWADHAELFIYDASAGVVHLGLRDV